mgnify:CR=1 FL=1|jgi:hypothetical protein
MQYTAGQAANAVGKNIATITRAIKSGKISASKGVDGAWRIDPAELHRVFPIAPQDLRKPKMQRDASPPQEAVSSSENVLLQEVAILRERVRAQEVLLSDRADQIDDLRSRLDKEGDERRRLAAILTDQSAARQGADRQADAARRRWWPFR